MRKLILLVVLGLLGCKPDVVPVVNPTPSLVQIGNNTNAIPNNLIKSTPAPPFNASKATSTPNPISKGIEFGPTIKRGPNPSNSKSVVLTQDDGGQAGFNFNENINGIYTNNTAYPNLNLNSAPLGSTNYNVLYAPTTRLGNGGCLEYGADYWRGANTQTIRALRLYNFCDNIFWSTGVDITIDANFQAQYLRDLGRGLPQYTTEIFRNATGTRLFLFNYKTDKWELIYTSSASNNFYNGGDTWSIFETHYTPGPCTILPTIVSSDIQIYTTKWIDLNNTQTYTPWGECLVESNGYATNEFISNKDTWQVISK